jgi:hypothetical protein
MAIRDIQYLHFCESETKYLECGFRERQVALKDKREQ